MLFSELIKGISDGIKCVEKRLLDSNTEFEKNKLKDELISSKNILTWFKDNKILITIYKNKNKYYISEYNLIAINNTCNFVYAKGRRLSECYKNLFTLKESHQNNSYYNFTMQKNNKIYFPISIIRGYNTDSYKSMIKAIKEYITVEEQEITFDMEDLQNKYENVLTVVNDMKHELNQKNNKIRDLEVRIHYLEMSSNDKKVNYDYEVIKQKNKALHTEFKRIYKLIRFA